MVEFALFRTRQFIGSNLIAFIITFAMMGTFFFMAIYMQDILGYQRTRGRHSGSCRRRLSSPSSRRSPGRLADRLGPGVPMSFGLAVLGVSMFMFAGIDTATTYSGLLVPFVLMGIGIALVMSPMSTAAMNAVSVQKSGVASGVLQMSRMVGASVGVAATGAIFQAQLGGAASIRPRWRALQSRRARPSWTHSAAPCCWPPFVVVAGLVVSLLLIRRSRGGRVDTHEAAEEAVEAIPVEAAVEEAVPVGAR